MLLGGIWDVWYHGDYGVKSFSIITTAPSTEIAPIHDRMPLVFPDRKQQELWLSDLPLDEVVSMMHPPDDGIFSMYPVTDMVNSVKNDGPELHNPVMT